MGESLIEYTPILCDAGPIPSLIGAELFRQRPRPKAMAVAGAVNWVATFVIALGFQSVAVSKLMHICYYYHYYYFLSLSTQFPREEN